MCSVIKVTTVITTFDVKNAIYLKWLFWSLARQLEVDNEVILVTHKDFVPDVPHGTKVLIRPKEETCNQYINAGFLEARPDSEVFFYMNDDVFLCENSLTITCQLAKAKNVIVNALCNTDNGFSYIADMPFRGVPLKQFLTFDDMNGSLESFFYEMNYAKNVPCIMFPLTWLCIYATAIPARTWRLLNGFDIENLPNGCADVDFCLRARKQNVRSMVTNNAFILHYGGVTSNITMTDETRKLDRKRFFDKWGFYPENV